jgi:hypothetical protein
VKQQEKKAKEPKRQQKFIGKWLKESNNEDLELFKKKIPKPNVGLVTSYKQKQEKYKIKYYKSKQEEDCIRCLSNGTVFMTECQVQECMTMVEHHDLASSANTDGGDNDVTNTELAKEDPIDAGDDESSIGSI